MIDVKNIYKTFWVPQEVRALVDVSTKIEAGEVVVDQIGFSSLDPAFLSARVER